MSEQQFQGALASGGTFVATAQGIGIFDPRGNQLASFDREIISGVSRDGQVVTLERRNDTIVTITASSITDAVGLEQFVRDTIIAPPTAAAGESGAAVPPRPPIISRLDPTYEAEVQRPEHDLPEPVPTAPTPAEPSEPEERIDVKREPLAPPVESPGAPPGQYGAPPPESPTPDATSDEEQGGRPRWLWGCLGCGGLLVLALVCVGVLLATGAIDMDELSGDDATPTPFVIVATRDDANPTPTPEAGNIEDPTETAGQGDGGTAQAQPPPSGDVMSAGESATVSDVEVTYLGSRTDSGGIVPPEEGNEYLILSFQFVNSTAESIFVSTLLQFELRNDAGEIYTVALFADMETPLDVEIAAGDTLEGQVAFEVPEGSGPFVVEYDDLISGSPLVWAVE